MSQLTTDGRYVICSQCQNQMRPLWTSKAMHCPCCHNLIKLTRLDIRPPTGTAAKCIFKEKIHKLKCRNSSSSSSNGTSSNSCSAPESGMTVASKEHSRKRAVLCGVSYKKKKYELKGTVNDVKHMKELLIHTFRFLEENIRVLTEGEKDEHRRPTRKNILDAFQWLIGDCRSGDSLVFFFSGHGLRHSESTDGDELDGFDESICPVDFTTSHVILDDEINSAIVRPLPNGVTLHALVDCCHSGTVLDLPYVYDIKKSQWMDNRPRSGANKGTNGGRAISLCACADEELAADTSALHRKMMSGAMTSSFIRAIQETPGITYKQLLKAMQGVIDEANKSNCLNSPILSRLFRAKMLQEPVLSCSEMIDIENMKFQL